MFKLMMIIGASVLLIGLMVLGCIGLMYIKSLFCDACSDNEDDEDDDVLIDDNNIE